jgi:Lon protease-like protein
LHNVTAVGVWQGDVTYLPEDPSAEVPSHLKVHADRLGKVIASAQQQGLIDIFPPYLVDDFGWLANRYAEALPVGVEVKLQLLSESDLIRRLESAIRLMQQEGPSPQCDAAKTNCAIPK